MVLVGQVVPSFFTRDDEEPMESVLGENVDAAFGIRGLAVFEGEQGEINFEVLRR
jgi:hypothetical protein